MQYTNPMIKTPEDGENCWFILTSGENPTPIQGVFYKPRNNLLKPSPLGFLGKFHATDNKSLHSVWADREDDVAGWCTDEDMQAELIANAIETVK